MCLYNASGWSPSPMRVHVISLARLASRKQGRKAPRTFVSLDARFCLENVVVASRMHAFSSRVLSFHSLLTLDLVLHSSRGTTDTRSSSQS